LKKTVFWGLFLLILVPILIFARPREFIREYTYIASEQDSRVSARANATDQMRALLLQEIGQVVIAEQRLHTESRHNEFIYDNFSERITAIAAGMVRMEILNETWDGHRFFIRAKMEVNPSEVSQRANEVLLNTTEMRALENKNREIMRQVENLNREISGLRNRAQRNENFLFAEINEYRAQNTEYLGQINQLRRTNSELAARHNREIAQRDSIINLLNLQLAQLQGAQTQAPPQRPVIVERIVEREVRVPVQTAPVSPPQDEIVISTTPSGALVFVNDEFVGRTPYTHRNAPHARLSIRVRATGFEPHIWDINYTGGRRVLDKTFAAQTPPPPPAPEAPRPAPQPVREGISTITRQDVVSGESLMIIDTRGVGNHYINVSINRIFATRMQPNAMQNFVLRNGQHTIVLSYISRDGARWRTLDERTFNISVSPETTRILEVSANQNRIQNVETKNPPGQQFVQGNIIRVR